jgi:hypothetical protein
MAELQSFVARTRADQSTRPLKKPAPAFTGNGPAPSPTSGRAPTVKESLCQLHAALQNCTPQSTNHSIGNAIEILR